MRRRRFMIGVVGATALALVLAAAAAAFETRTTVAEQFTNPCTGETFVAEGTVTMRTEAKLGADGKLHERWHINHHAGTAKGVVTGAKYVVQRQLNEGTNMDADGMPTTIHHISKEHYVRSGENGALLEDDDFYVYFHLHVTINSNGVPTSVKVDSTPVGEECR